MSNTTNTQLQWYFTHHPHAYISNGVEVPRRMGIWSILHIDRSDGVVLNPPHDRQRSDGVHIYYADCAQDSEFDIDYRVKMGAKMQEALNLGIFRKCFPLPFYFILPVLTLPIAGFTGYILDWPSGFTLYKKVTSDYPRPPVLRGNLRNGTRRADMSILGHPRTTTWDKMDHATTHFTWLAGALPGACPCNKCSPATFPLMTLLPATTTLTLA